MQRLLNYLTGKAQRWQLWFWIIVLLEGPAAAYLSSEGIGDALVFRAFGMISKMGAAYTLAFFLIPRFWFRKRYFAFAGWLVVWAVVFSFMARFINVHFAERLLGMGAPYESLWVMIVEFEFTMEAYFNRFFGIAFWFAFIKIGIDQLRSKEQLLRLRQEKAEAELSFLKVQMHPHFLFNTLNNLYTLTLEKSEEAPRVVIKLSEMLDYLLYQCNAPHVPINREIELLENYIGLEALRYGERLELSFEHSVSDKATPVAPLLLLPLVENAFKHGIRGAIGRHLIRLDLRIEQGTLIFNVENTKPTDPVLAATGGGIGLQNLRSQLELTYPGCHALKISEETDRYLASLKIELS